MIDDEIDPALLVGLHKLAQQNGDGLIPALHERLNDVAAVRAKSAEIIRLPGLHERHNRPIYVGASRCDAKIIDFPLPRWQRNASRQRG
ncbi:hypothetical protein [Rhizobium sp. CAU 1783]